VFIGNAQKNYCQDQIKDIDYTLDEKGYPVFSYIIYDVDTSFINLLQLNSYKTYKIDGSYRIYCNISYNFEDKTYKDFQGIEHYNNLIIKFTVSDYIIKFYKKDKKDIREFYPLIEKEKRIQAYRFNKMKKVLDIKFEILKQQIIQRHFNPKIVKPNLTNNLTFIQGLNTFVIDSTKTIDTISIPLRNVIFAFNDKISKLESKNIQAGNDLINFHEQYSSGIRLIGLGIVSNIIGVGVLSGVLSDEPYIELGCGLMVGGSILTIAGGVIMIDAHKHIKMAGRDLKMQVSPNKVSIKMKLYR